MADIPKYYWDSCAWLGLLNYENDKIAPLHHYYNLATRNQCEIWTSTIAYVEVFRLHVENDDAKPLKEENLDKIKDVIEQPFVKLIPADMIIGRRARALRRELPDFQGAGDAIHIASALVWNIHQIHTWDGSHMLPWNMKLVCRDGTKLSIVKPVLPPAGPLFAGTEGQP